MTVLTLICLALHCYAPFCLNPPLYAFENHIDIFSPPVGAAMFPGALKVNSTLLEGIFILLHRFYAVGCCVAVYLMPQADAHLPTNVTVGVRLQCREHGIVTICGIYSTHKHKSVFSRQPHYGAFFTGVQEPTHFHHIQ